MSTEELLVEPDVGIQPARLFTLHLQPREGLPEPRALPQVLSQLDAAYGSPAVAPVGLHIYRAISFLLTNIKNHLLTVKLAIRGTVKKYA